MIRSNIKIINFTKRLESSLWNVIEFNDVIVQMSAGKMIDNLKRWISKKLLRVIQTKNSNNLNFHYELDFLLIKSLCRCLNRDCNIIDTNMLMLIVMWVLVALIMLSAILDPVSRVSRALWEILVPIIDRTPVDLKAKFGEWAGEFVAYSNYHGLSFFMGIYKFRHWPSSCIIYSVLWLISVALTHLGSVYSPFPSVTHFLFTIR